MEFDGVSLTLSGKEYRLHYNLRAMRLFQQITGKSLLKTVNLGELTEAEIAAIVWAGLQCHHPDLNLETVEALIGYFDVSTVIATLAVAFGAALPRVEETDQSPPEESRPTG